MRKFFYTTLLTSVLALSALDANAQGMGQSRDRQVRAITQDNIVVLDTGLAVVVPRTLSRGQVREIQGQLAGKGNFGTVYYRGFIDGIWGPQTAAAVGMFQRDHGLWAGGYLTTSTLAQLGLDIDAGSNPYADYAPAAGR